jgi:hypothetical protein
VPLILRLLPQIIFSDLKIILFTPTPTSTANAFLPPTMASTQAPKTTLPPPPTLASHPASTLTTTPTFIRASTSAPIPIPMFALTFTTIYIFNF